MHYVQARRDTSSVTSRSPIVHVAIKYRVKCEGYPGPYEQVLPAWIALLKPRPYSGPTSLAISSRAPLYQSPPVLVVRTDIEGRYFEAFRREAVPEISGVWDSSLWDTIVLTTCDEPFVRDAVLAIAAISLSMKERRLNQLSDGLPERSNLMVAMNHYTSALERYGRAVRAMKSTLTNDEQHLRKALIGCLLVFTFEGFQGFTKQSLLHAISGYHLLESWMIKESIPRILPKKNAPPASSILENELITAFENLYISAASVIGDSCSEDLHVAGNLNSDQIIQEMPKVFTDIGEAHDYFVVLMKRSAGFIQLAAGQPVSTSSPPNTVQDQEQSTTTIDWGPFIHTPFPTGIIPPHISAACRKHIKQLEQWQSALFPLRVRASTDLANQIGTTVLQAAYISLSSECYWDAFMPEFRAIVSLSKTLFRILPEKRLLTEKGGFKPAITIVPPLYAVCKFCRDWGLRREAMALLNLSPRRERVWDARLGVTHLPLLVSAVSQFLISVEEEGAVDGYIPELARTRMTRVAVNVSTNTAEVECQRRRPDGDGVEVFKRIIHEEGHSVALKSVLRFYPFQEDMQRLFHMDIFLIT